MKSDRKERCQQLLRERYQMMDMARELFFPNKSFYELNDAHMNVMNNICNDILVAEEEYHHGH